MTDLPDERTLPARRARVDAPVEANEPDEPDDATALSGSRASELPVLDEPQVVGRSEDADAPEDSTVLSGRRAAALPAPREPSIEEAPAGPRRTGAAPATPIDPDDGSTIVVRRRTDAPVPEVARDVEVPVGIEGPGEIIEVETAASGRSRELAATMAADVPAPLGRLAHAPEATGATYAARQAPPAMVTRNVAPARGPQDQLDGQATTAAARKRRRRALLVIVAASLLVVVAATVLIVIAVTG